MRVLAHIAMTLALLATVGCVHPYRTEVQQGNVITQDMIDKLKPGMTKSQVRFVLGTPLIIDAFHPERWDYIYLYKKDVNAPAETRHFTVIFNGDSLARIEADASFPPAATALDQAGGASTDQEASDASTSPRAL